MKIAEAYVEIRSKDGGAKADAKKIVDDIGKQKPKPIEVDADTKPAQDELNKLEGVSKAKGSSIAKNLVGLFSAGIFVDQVGKAIGAASDLEQATGGTKAVFQESSGVIDRWAANSAEKFGLSERAFREATSQIGAALKGYGLNIDEAADKSVELTSLGGDLAATFGGTVPDAVGALGATLRGEFDPAERYGIALSAAKVEAKALELGLVGLDGKMTASGKVQATLALITEQTADAQGQFAREADTAGGQTERLKAKFEDMQASIGSNLLPVFAKVVSTLATVADFFGDLPGPVQTAIVAMAGIAIVAGPIKNVVTGFTGIADAIKKVGPAATAAGGLIAAATGIYLLYANEKSKAEQTTREFTEALKAEQAGQAGATSAAIAAKLSTEEFVAVAKAAGISVGDIAKRINGETVPALDKFLSYGGDKDRFDWVLAMADDLGVSEEALLNFVETIDGSEDAMAAARGEVAAFNTVQKELGTETERTGGFFKRATDDLTGAGSAAKGASGWFGDAASGFGKAGDSAADMAEDVGKARDSIYEAGSYAEQLAEDQLAGLEDAQDDAAKAAEGLASALDEVFGGAVDLQGAADQLAADTDALTESFKENKRTLDQSTEAGRTNREAVRQSVSGIQDYIGKLAESGATATTVNSQYGLLRSQLVNQMLPAFNGNREAAEAYINELGLTPDNVTTAINLSNVEPAREAIRQHIERVGAIPPNKLTVINAEADQGDLNAVQTALDRLTRDRIVRVQTQATGGNYVPPGTPRAVAEGGFFRGGSTRGDIFTLAEKAGRRGDEVVLPLGNDSRLSTLINMPEVRDRVAAALDRDAGRGGVAVMAGGGGISIGSVTVAEPQDFRRELERIEFERRGRPVPVSVGPA